ncbi:MAG: helix-turn-helix domain-containing protein [Clostridia bacterium]|nr:helix-turn-helix domain-containing protein [Clostridia bacterium]
MKLTDGGNLCGIKILDEKTRLLPIYFHSIGHYVTQKHIFRPNGLGQYQFCLCLGGSGIFNVNDVEYPIQRGDIFFLSPQVSHEYSPTSDKWSVIWVVFNGLEVERLKEYFDFEDTFVCHADDRRLNEMVSVCQRMFETYNKNERYEFSLTMNMLTLIQLVSGCERITQKSEAKDIKGGFAPVIEYIKKNYMKPVTLDDMAWAGGLSKSHFCRKFKAKYAVTPMVYLNSYRVSIAKFLLSTTAESIDIIAEKTGFSDTSYFCAVFKRIEGTSPGQYRQQRHKVFVQ